MYFCWSRWLFFIVVAVLALLSMLSGCGLKGPLYLPTETTASAPSPAAASPAAEKEN